MAMVVTPPALDPAPRLFRFDDVVEQILVSLQNLGVPADQVSFARALLRGDTVDTSASYVTPTTCPLPSLLYLNT